MRRPDRMKPLFVITLVARPREHTKASTEVGGAYVNAWVDAASEDEALERAQREVREAEWVFESIDETSHLVREDYEPDDPSLEYFDQALVDGAVLVFHQWPLEPQEDDVTH